MPTGKEETWGGKNGGRDTFTTAVLKQSVTVIWLLRDTDGGTERDELVLLLDEARRGDVE